MDRRRQADDAPDQRGDAGLEGVFREIFPIESYDKTLKLEYIRYDLGKPRYDPDECRQLRLTYGRPLHVWLRLDKGETTLEESVYLGDMPLMIGGGEFIINGAERVVVSQLHRSPGVDFVVEIESGDKKLHACRVIPERGSWIELQVTKKDTLGVRIDQSGKFSAITLMRAMSPKYSSEEEILKAPEKDYMNEAQLAFFRQRLVEIRDQLLQNADDTGEHLRENEITTDPSDRATLEEEYTLELRTRDRERKLLKKVEKSIRMIDDGSYGFCEETGEPIGVPRLLARPTATLSLEAQERRERVQKLYGD